MLLDPLLLLMIVTLQLLKFKTFVVVLEVACGSGGDPVCDYDCG